MWDNLKLITVKGREIEPYADALALLRIRVFKEYPYLYNGDVLFEAGHMQTYVETPECSIIIVMDGEKPVGMATALPLEFDNYKFQKPFIDEGKALEDYFYFGQALLLRAYRGQNIYPKFFELREQAARDYGCKFATFCAIDRKPNDKRKPQEYRSLDTYWQQMKYKKHPELFTELEWKETGEKIVTSKKMIFWIKRL